MIEATGITKRFAGRRGPLHHDGITALDRVDFALPDAGAASLIGESGCGKTTLGRILAGLELPDDGELFFAGKKLSALPTPERRRLLQRVQLIHQDPYAALNPSLTIGQTLAAPLRLRARESSRSAAWIATRARELLSLVGLDPEYCLPRYPHMLSGGMRQRVVIARALTVDPAVLVADEAVSMIDVSLRLGILGLFRELREQLGIGVVFITHDVAAARYVGMDTELYVLYRGRVVERGAVDDLVSSPLHPYTQCLLSAIPVLRGLEQPGDDRILPRAGLDPELVPPGCLFSDRCPFATAECGATRPPLRDVTGSIRAHACLWPTPRRVVAVANGRGEHRTDRGA